MATEIPAAKPVCGGGGINGSEEDFDISLHIAAIFLVLGASVFGAGFPVMAKKVRWMRIPPKVFFFCKHFGTGVLIATAFVHLLPTAFLSLSNPCLPDIFIKNYPPMPGVIMMASLFILFVIEMWLNAKTGGHNHGGPTGQNFIPSEHSVSDPYTLQPPSRPFTRADSYSSEHTLHGDDKDDKITTVREYPAEHRDSSEMPPWFVVFYEQYIRQRDEMLTVLHRATPFTSHKHDLPVPSDPEALDPTATDPQVLRKMSLNITLLEGGILFHSVFVGMTVSITTTGFVVLLIAILFHQMFEGLGLGSRIAAVPYAKGSWRPWILVVAFGTTAPIGQAIGLASRGSYDPDSALGLIIVGVFNAISSGLLVYASLVDLLAEDFLSEEARLLSYAEKCWAFVYVLLGAVGMSVVGVFA